MHFQCCQLCIPIINHVLEFFVFIRKVVYLALDFSGLIHQLLRSAFCNSFSWETFRSDFFVSFSFLVLNTFSWSYQRMCSYLFFHPNRFSFLAGFLAPWKKKMIHWVSWERKKGSQKVEIRREHRPDFGWAAKHHGPASSAETSPTIKSKEWQVGKENRPYSSQAAKEYEPPSSAETTRTMEST